MWTYSGWESEPTRTAQLAMLKLHIKEITDVLSGSQSVGKDGASLSKFDLLQLRDSLRADRDKLEAKISAASGPKLVGFRRPR
jgi:hypothetical protein